MKKTQVIIVSVFGLLVLLVIWTISAMKGKEENQNTVRLSTDNKDVTITDVKAQLERTPLRKQAEGQGGRGIRAEGGYRLLYPSHTREPGQYHP